MALSPGTRLGSYEVVARLGRDVAVKIFFQGPYEGSPRLMAVSVTAAGDTLRLAPRR